jgi:hypothetical protein
MNLLPEWKETLKKAWSVRLIVLAGLLSGCEVILPMYSESIPRGLFAILTIVVAIGAMVARVTVQKKMGND